MAETVGAGHRTMHHRYTPMVIAAVCWSVRQLVSVMKHAGTICSLRPVVCLLQPSSWPQTVMFAHYRDAVM